MQTKKKKIKFQKSDIIITKKGYELYPHEIIKKYFSKKKGHYIEFYVRVCWNSETKNLRQLKTIKQQEEQWSSLHVRTVDKIKHIKRPTCKLKPIL